MGILDAIKKQGKRFVEKQQEIGKKNQALRKERKEFNAEVNRAVLGARREQYKKEALVQAKVRGKIDAQRKFNPTPQQSASGGMSAEARAIIYGSGGFGSPSPVQQQVVQKIRSQKSPAKKKKKGSTRTRTVVKYVEKPKPVDAVADLLSRLPE